MRWRHLEHRNAHVRHTVAELAVDRNASLHGEAVVAGHERSVRVELEVARTAVERLVALLQHEEGVALDREVRVAAGGLEVTVREHRIHRTDLRTQTDLHG